MKRVNIQSIFQAASGLNDRLKTQYFEMFQIEPKEIELEGLQILCEELSEKTDDASIFDNYFFGYTIPQISKEFDLLRLDNHSIVNIELKSQTNTDRIQTQLLKNRYYLGFLNREIYSFTFVSSDRTFYTLNEHDQLVVADVHDVIIVLRRQFETGEVDDLNRLFNPSNYLISPFNSTEEFVQNKYFLTELQEKIKKASIDQIKTAGISFISICGKAGTGKTLLTFDIAKELRGSGLKVLIIHCGILNAGHYKLVDVYGWDIVAIRDWGLKKLSGYQLIILDETQRIRPWQFEQIVNGAKTHGVNCIFSYDQQQCLREWESKNNITQVIEDLTSSTLHELTKKIRTNKEIASFIVCLLDRGKKVEYLNRDNIELVYFQYSSDAEEHIRVAKNYGWTLINYTPSRGQRFPYSNYRVLSAETAHEVIGQEFDKVLAIVDETFCYDGNKLSVADKYASAYYEPVKMLFQILTRTRRKLQIVIVNNEEVMSRCLDILNPQILSDEEDNQVVDFLEEQN